MPKQISLPDCLMDAYQLIFPDLDWGKVTFYDGIPFPLGLGGATGFAEPKLGATKIYLKEGSYNPCDADKNGTNGMSTFRRIAHELVHAMQYQKALTRCWGAWST